jgi:hypothetical protein
VEEGFLLPAISPALIFLHPAEMPEGKTSLGDLLGKIRDFRIMLTLTLIIPCTCADFAGDSSSPVIGHSDPLAVNARETVEVVLGVKELPEGLLGFSVIVELDDPDVAEIEAVSFPAWAMMNAMFSPSGYSVWFTATDLANNVAEGVNYAEFATLSLRGLASGSTGITVTVSRLDRDSEASVLMEKEKSP